MSSDKTIKSQLPEKKNSPQKAQVGTSKGFKPKIYVITPASTKEYPIEKDQGILTLGKGEEADILIDDAKISNIQLAIIRVGSSVLFVDRGMKDCCTFDGSAQRQVLVPSATRMIVTVGDFIVIYCGLDSENYDDTDSIVLKKELLKNIKNDFEIPKGTVKVSGSAGVWVSNQRPCLIGKHHLCDYKIDDGKTTDFHCLVFWTVDGIAVKNLTYERMPVKLNGVAIKETTLLPEENNSLKIGNTNLEITLTGEIPERCNGLFSKLTIPKLVLRLVSKSEKRCYPLPLPGIPFTIGRSDENDIALDDGTASRVHAKISTRAKSLVITDNDSQNKTFVNYRAIKRETVHPGDIIEIGHTTFLVHYEVQE